VGTRAVRSSLRSRVPSWRASAAVRFAVAVPAGPNISPSSSADRADQIVGVELAVGGWRKSVLICPASLPRGLHHHVESVCGELLISARITNLPHTERHVALSLPIWLPRNASELMAGA
jgi:hypothetical protein